MAQQRHSRFRMAALLARRERRGWKYAELSVASGVPVPTLSWWASRLRREREVAASFVEVVPSGSAALPAQVEIVLRSGRQLLVREEIASATLARLVSALEA